MDARPHEPESPHFYAQLGEVIAHSGHAHFADHLLQLVNRSVPAQWVDLSEWTLDELPGHVLDIKRLGSAGHPHARPPCLTSGQDQPLLRDMLDMRSTNACPWTPSACPRARARSVPGPVNRRYRAAVGAKAQCEKQLDRNLLQTRRHQAGRQRPARVSQVDDRRGSVWIRSRMKPGPPTTEVSPFTPGPLLILFAVATEAITPSPD